MDIEMKVCNKDECEKKAYTRGLCNKHYVEERFAGVECVTDGCEAPAKRTGDRCIEHYNAWLYSPAGQAGKKVYRVSNEYGYSAAHARVKSARGQARLYWCVDCDERAQEWSLKADSSVQLVGENTYYAGSFYSTNVEDYEPRCTPCHRAHDSKYGVRRTSRPTTFKDSYSPETRAKATKATEMIKSGMTVTQVAEAMGVNISSVSGYFYGIERKTIREWKKEQKAGAAR